MSTPTSAAAGRNALLDTSGRPDAAELGVKFAVWLCARLGTDVEVRHAAFPSEGGSSYNLLVETDVSSSWRSIVLKLATPIESDRIFPDEDLFQQARWMSVMAAATDLPIPRPLAAEHEAGHLGMPFLVLPRLPGRAWPSDPPYTFSGWALRASPQARQAMQSELIDVLARIHAVTADRFDLDDFARPDLGEEPLAALIGRVRAHYEWARGAQVYPLLERALEWLSLHQPYRDGPACVTWGDARAGNLLFDGPRVAAVLDWEGATLGYPEVDLAFVAVMHSYYQRRAEAAGLRGLPECFTAADLSREYHHVTGCEPTDLHWYLVLAAARAAAIQVRFLARTYATGRPPPDDLDAALGMGEILRRLLDS